MKKTTSIFESIRLGHILALIVCLAVFFGILHAYTTLAAGGTLGDVIIQLSGGLATECLGAAIFTYVFNIIYGRNKERELKEAEVIDIIESMSSPSENEARRAYGRIHRLGWFQDGTLNGYDAGLSNLNLPHVDFSKAQLSKTTLVNSTLNGSDFSGAVIRGTRLRKCNLADADFTGADLAHSVLSQANLEGANLMDAKLHCVVMTDARIKGARFTNANLTGVDLRTIDLRAAADLSGAIYDRDTIFPEGFDPNAFGMLFEEQ